MLGRAWGIPLDDCAVVFIDRCTESVEAQSTGYSLHQFSSVLAVVVLGKIESEVIHFVANVDVPGTARLDTLFNEVQ